MINNIKKNSIKIRDRFNKHNYVFELIMGMDINLGSHLALSGFYNAFIPGIHSDILFGSSSGIFSSLIESKSVKYTWPLHSAGVGLKLKW